MKRLSRILAAGMWVCFSQAAQAATWYVDASVTSSGDGASWGSAFKTIQKGINAASGGDTVIVAEGTYAENIYFYSKNITLTSTDPFDPDLVDATILDGTKSGPVVTFDGTEDETCVLQGFRLQNGSSNVGGGIRGRRFVRNTCATIQNNIITLNSGGYGAGLAWCDGLIQNNTITENHAERRGGGLQNCHGIIQNNTIIGNTADEDGGGVSSSNGEIRNNTIEQNSGFYGGGLYWCNGTIENNTIAGNTAAREGGGLAFCDGIIRNNTITGNSAANDEGGGLAYCDGMILDNLIQGNWASYHGGGLSYCFATIQNNVITGNSAILGGGLSFCDLAILSNTIARNAAALDGGGVYGCNGLIDGNLFSENVAERDGGALACCFATIQNNMVVGNSAGRYGGGLAVCRGPIQNNTVTGNAAGDKGGGFYRCQGDIGNSIIWRNTAPDGPQLAESSAPIFSCIEDWEGGGEGNIAEDPQFADGVGGNYALESSSPCIDAGSNFYWFAWPQRDIRGNCRLAGGRVDMGCYEHGATVDTDGDLLSDEDESAAGTDPECEDTDGDGLRDGLEVLDGTNPVAVTSPRTVYVPSQIPRIQMALLLAVNGEEIVVAPGTYRENLHFYGADVILRSANPEDPDVVQATVLDGGGAGPVVSFSGRESQACVVSGFTITGGYAYSGGGIKGGTPDTRTRATIQNNRITGNAAAVHGGGLYLCDGLIKHNTIAGNSAARRGGGLYGCSGAIQTNTISYNSAGGFGGGLFGCDGIIQNNHIVANAAEGTYLWQGQEFGDGGGLCSCNAIIRNNIIAGNRALSGGGLQNCNGVTENNTITGNSASNSGGGICECNGTIVNCVIWGNTATTNAGEQLYASSVPSYSCIQDWPGGGEGNIAENPRFVDADGPDDDWATFEDNDYRLSPGSPCIDAGRNELWMGSALDLDGNPRICLMTYPPTVDMGAYEYVFSEPRIAALHVDASVASSGNGTSWETALRAIQEGIDAASDGEIVIVAEGRYTENIQFHGKNIVVRSRDPLDPAVVSRTVIAGSSATGRVSVVTFAGTEEETCVLSGFTISNGNAAYGGGICGGSSEHQTHATIENNIITSNSADSGGGLAYCGGIVQGNTIAENSATNAYGEGGGLAFCDGTIRNNIIRGNSCVWRGGGLARCNGNIQGNTISANSASSGAGLAYCEGCIERNMISQNSAKVWGGGLYRCGGDIQNNKIVGNSAGLGGGALASCGGAIRNNTIVGNSAGNTGGGLAWCDNDIRNCIVWGNTAPTYPQVYQSPEITYSCIQDWTEGGEGNISDNPRFVDPEGPDKASRTYDDNDYHLLPDSPCVDAGRNEGWMLETVDLDGNPRLWNGRVDMGVYEYDSFAFKITKLIAESVVRLIWNSREGDTYTVEASTDLSAWTEQEVVASQGAQTTWSDPHTTSEKQYYRIGRK
jgi:hypothetical protein